jgi:hypothetical protein
MSADRVQVGQPLERVSCECSTCRSWCDRVPGWFKPGEMEQAAQLVGLSPLTFFRQHVTVDYWCGDTVFTLRPRTVKESGGSEAPYNPLGRCAFYRDGKCGIHAAKPHECATSKHDVTLPKDWHEQTANAWRTPESQAMIKQLLGREPQEQDGNPFELLFGGLI